VKGGVVIPCSARAVIGLVAVALCFVWGRPSPAHPQDSAPVPAPDTLRFDPSPDDSLFWTEDEEAFSEEVRFDGEGEDSWLRAPIGDHLLTDVDEWRARENGWSHTSLVLDYNRVDRLRLGVGHQIQSSQPMLPRLGARIEYAFQRERTLYGVQIEQPLLPPGRLALGISMVRRTDHGELQQVENVENSLALLFGRQDYRDYFEREGHGAYLAWRVPDFSTVSLHVRRDDYRSLPLDRGTRSFFHRDRELRENPPVDEGEAHGLAFRLERLAHRTHRTRAGFYHWIDVERTGHGLGGDFEFTRLLADLRSVVRLSPATSLALRMVAGHTRDGVLPFQKQFTAGGVDGLRAHSFAEYRGDQMVLGQAEYTVGLWQMRSGMFQGGLHAIAFVDVGTAWSNPGHRWDLDRQVIQTDGGFGLGTSEDNLRVYVAKDLRASDSDLVVSLRLQRPF
jgi:hypothetical protein